MKQDQFNGDVILHHVTNNPDSTLVSFPPILGMVDLSISKHVVMLWIVAFITVSITLYATKAYRSSEKKSLNKLSSIFEVLMEFIRKDIVVPNIGKSHSQSWTPLIATFFIFILVGNFVGMIPFFEKVPFVSGSSTITGNFAVTAALACITFVSIIIAGTLKHGFINHWKNMIPGGVPAPVLIILIPTEILGMFIKPLALTLRLGANMTAGHIGLLAIFGIPMILSQTYGSGVGMLIGLIAVLLNIGIFMLEIIVCLVQAYVFALLSAVFIGMAIHAEH